MGCNLGKGSQPDDSEVRDKSNATSPQTPPPGMLADRMADGAAMVNKACNDVQHVYREITSDKQFDRQAEPVRTLPLGVPGTPLSAPVFGWVPVRYHIQCSYFLTPGAKERQYKRERK
ncbi:hypothetical protein MTO96_034530 [Rhipicephalus appendiculatus]